MIYSNKKLSNFILNIALSLQCKFWDSLLMNTNHIKCDKSEILIIKIYNVPNNLIAIYSEFYIQQRYVQIYYYVNRENFVAYVIKY